MALKILTSVVGFVAVVIMVDVVVDGDGKCVGWLDSGCAP